MNEQKCPRCQTLLTLRHCLACGYTKPLSLEERLRQGLIKPHSKPEPNDGAFVLPIIEAYNITLPLNAIAWRAVRLPDGTHPRGEIPSLNLSCELLITDGVVAWFLLNNETPFYGHLANFVADKPESEAVIRPKKAKELTAKQKALTKALLED